MTISSTTRTAGPFTGTGLVSTFSFSFKVFQASDLLVVRQTISTGSQTTFILNTDYTVSLNVDQDSNPGGSITLVAGALASTYTLVITSSIANLQPTILTNQGGFYPEVINDSLDRATIQIQQVAVKSGRELSAPLVDGAVDMVLPSALNRASKFLYFGASGEPMAAAGTNTGNNTSPGNLTLTANNAGSNTARDVIFYDNTTETMRILGSGATSKVGIGTSSPTRKLEVATSSNSLQIVSAIRNAQAGTGVAAIGFNVSDTSEAHSTKAGIGLLRTSTNGVGTLCFYNNANSGGSGDFTTSDERMRIENGGNVIIGNVTAAGNTSRNLDIYNYATGASAASVLRLITHDAGGTPAPSSIGQLVKYQTGGFAIQNTDTNAAAHMSFWVANTENMRIDSSGNVGIGTGSPGSRLDVQGGQIRVRSTGAYAEPSVGAGTLYYDATGGNFTIDSRSSSGNTALLFRTSNGGTGANRMSIQSTGEVWIAGSSDQGAYNLQCNGTGVWGAGAYVNGSDSRIKHDINPIGSCLDVVAAIEPVTFVYNAEWSSDQTVQTGFIAQQLQTALAGQPYLDGIVSQGGQYLNVAYQNIIPLLTKSIQELKAIVEAQAARIAALEARA